jgi:hypothetical protein
MRNRTRGFHFPEWPEVLARAPLSPARRESYAITLRRYRDRPPKEVREEDPLQGKTDPLSAGLMQPGA